MKFCSQSPCPRFLMVIMSLCVLVGCGSKIEVPTSFERWKDEDGAFSIDYPSDWEADGGGKNGVKWAEFTMGSAVIKLDFDTTSSIVGDIAGSQGNILGIGEQGLSPEDEMRLAPVHQAHMFNKDRTALLFSNYEETAPVKYKSGLGDSRKSEFVSSSITGSVRGYRTTSLTLNQGVIITCTCSPSDWDTLKPAFDRVLESLGR